MSGKDHEIYNEEFLTFYGSTLERIKEEIEKVVDTITEVEEPGETKKIEHIKSRIKNPVSVEKKLKSRGFEFSLFSCFKNLTDYAGIRIVCSFLDDIYTIRDKLETMENVKILEEEDYVKYPKPNGYRSYHLLLEIDRPLMEEVKKTCIEVQIRTISQDSWASLEHQLKYKKDIKNSEMIVEELKRCAEEMASTDLTMQTIRDWIEGKIKEDS